MNHSLQPKFVSEIDVSDKEKLVIHYQKTRLSIGQVLSVFLMISVLLSFVLFVIEIESLYILIVFSSIPVLILLINYFNKNNVDKILIDNRSIQKCLPNNNNELLYLKNNNIVNFQVKILASEINLKIDNQVLKLSNANDIPIVIDKIAALWDLEYYDSNTLDETTEILTYKSKIYQIIGGFSLVQIKNHKSKLRIQDDLNAEKWFEIDKKTQRITSSHQDLPYQVGLGELEAIEVIFFPQRLVSKKNLFKIEAVFAHNQRFDIFQTDARFAKDKATTLRDIGKVIETLKQISVLKNVKISKVII